MVLDSSPPLGPLEVLPGCYKKKGRMVQFAGFTKELICKFTQYNFWIFPFF